MSYASRMSAIPQGEVAVIKGKPTIIPKAQLPKQQSGILETTASTIENATTKFGAAATKIFSSPNMEKALKLIINVAIAVISVYVLYSLFKDDKWVKIDSQFRRWCLLLVALITIASTRRYLYPKKWSEERNAGITIVQLIIFLYPLYYISSDAQHMNSGVATGAKWVFVILIVLNALTSMWALGDFL